MTSTIDCVKTPLILEREKSIPTFERNQLTFNYETNLSNVTVSIKKEKPSSTKVLIIWKLNTYSTVEFNDREYNLKEIHYYIKSHHKITTDLSKDNSFKIPAADIEIVLYHETTFDKQKDILNISILGEKGGNEFDRSNSFLNQVFPKVKSTNEDSNQEILISNGLNLYDILPQNRSFFSYSGTKFSGPENPKCIQWIVFENSIKINSNEYNYLVNKLKAGNLVSLPIAQLPDSTTYIYYRLDKENTLASMDSGDVKYMKCSRKMDNNDPDIYRKYIYDKNKKEQQCNNILNLNKNLQNEFNDMNDNSDISILSIFKDIFGDSKKDKNNFKIFTSILLFVLLFCMIFVLSVAIVIALTNALHTIKPTEPQLPDPPEPTIPSPISNVDN